MTVQRVRKPPFVKPNYDKIKWTLDGNHTAKQKLAMMTQWKFHLHELGIDHIGRMVCYAPLIDAYGHELTTFSDGTQIADYDYVINSPYHCAADEYDRRLTPAGPRPF